MASDQKYIITISDEEYIFDINDILELSKSSESFLEFKIYELASKK